MTILDPPLAPRARGNSTLIAANYLGKSQVTLRRWRMTGAGPVFRIINGRACYDLDHLDAFINAHPCVRSTSELSAISQRMTSVAA